jgi:hypothetical protein
MAAFATFTAAEQRAYAKVLDKTWVNAHAQRGFTGTIGVRVQRFQSSASDATRSAGAWVEITDDATV